VSKTGSIHVDVLVIGAGLAGLAARAAIGSKLDALTVEAACAIGGLARVYPADRFVFDSVPHVLQFRSSQLVAALEKNLPSGLRWFPKSSLIYQNGDVIRYPYQFNAIDLPQQLRSRCLQAINDTKTTAQMVHSRIGSFTNSEEDSMKRFLGPIIPSCIEHRCTNSMPHL
jgi:protoporphyrinogen oxidase